MKGYFLYLLKKRLPVFITITVITTVFFLIYNSVAYTNTYESKTTAYYPCLVSYAVVLGILCFITPMIEFSFKMKKTTAIHIYSLPIKQKKVYIIRYIMGFLEIAIPFAIAYMISIGAVFIGRDYVNVGLFFLYLPAILIVGLLTYSYFAFFYSRANTVIDGIVISILSFTGPLLIGVAVGSKLSTIPNLWKYYNCSYLFYAVSPIVLFDHVTTWFQNWVFPNPQKAVVNFEKGYYFCLAAYFIICIGTIVLLYFLTSKDKVEDASQKTTSWFGYKSLVPIAGVGMAAASSFLGTMGGVLVVLTIAFTYLEYALASRKFDLNVNWIWFSAVASCEILAFLLLV